MTESTVQKVSFKMFDKDFTLLVDDKKLKEHLLSQAYDIAADFLSLDGYWETEKFDADAWEKELNDKEIESFDDIREDYEAEMQDWFYDLIRENGEFSAGTVLHPYNDNDKEEVKEFFLNLEELYLTFKDDCKNSIDVFFYLLHLMHDNKTSDLNYALADLTKEDEEYCENVLGEISGAIDEKLDELDNEFSLQRENLEDNNNN